MKKEQLREGLKRLQSYIEPLDFHSTFLEESPEVPLDSLVIPLQIGEDLSIDISCNFVYIQDIGEILQFYGQIMLDEILEEAEQSVSDDQIRDLLNRLNSLLPIGQLLYLHGGETEDGERFLGLRYTMLTELDSEREWKRCVHVLMLLMQVYEFLCSCLLLLVDGESVTAILDTMKELMGE